MVSIHEIFRREFGATEYGPNISQDVSWVISQANLRIMNSLAGAERYLTVPRINPFTDNNSISPTNIPAEWEDFKDFLMPEDHS